MTEYVLGIDVGGTRVKSGAVSREGNLSAAGITPSGFSLDTQRLLDTLVEIVRNAEDQLGASPCAIGLGFPGAIEPTQGVVMLPGKLKGLEGFPVVSLLKEKVDIPVVAENDGRISILAEAKYGAAQHHKWAVTITLGTGVGSGVMLDGKVLRDDHLQFGTQLGHLVMQTHGGRLCITGAKGTAETICSASALAMAVRDGLQRGLPSLLSESYVDDPKSIDFQAVIEGVIANDKLCCVEFETWKTNLGWLLVTAVHAYAPDIIILSGGASNAAELFLDDIQNHVNQHCFRHPVGEPVPVVVSSLRDHAGVLGAAAVAWEHADTIGRA